MTRIFGAALSSLFGVGLTVVSSARAGNDAIDGGDGDDTILGQGGSDTLLGGRGQDAIAGGDGNDMLFGQEGADVLFGEAGADLLAGGPGCDIVNGGLGGDLFQFGLGDQGDFIMNFNEGGVRDGFDLRPLFDAAGYAGTNPRGEGVLAVYQSGADADVYIFGVFYFRVQNVVAAAIDDSYFLFQ